jgi:hypothetical protein
MHHAPTLTQCAVKRVYHELPTIMTTIAKEELADLPDAVATCNVVYMPQVSGRVHPLQQRQADLNCAQLGFFLRLPARDAAMVTAESAARLQLERAVWACGHWPGVGSGVGHHIQHMGQLHQTDCYPVPAVCAAGRCLLQNGSHARYYSSALQGGPLLVRSVNPAVFAVVQRWTSSWATSTAILSARQLGVQRQRAMAN